MAGRVWELPFRTGSGTEGRGRALMAAGDRERLAKRTPWPALEQRTQGQEQKLVWPLSLCLWL